MATIAPTASLSRDVTAIASVTANFTSMSASAFAAAATLGYASGTRTRWAASPPSISAVAA